MDISPRPCTVSSEQYLARYKTIIGVGMISMVTTMGIIIAIRYCDRYLLFSGPPYTVFVQRNAIAMSLRSITPQGQRSFLYPRVWGLRDLCPPFWSCRGRKSIVLTGSGGCQSTTSRWAYTTGRGKFHGPIDYAPVGTTLDQSRPEVPRRRSLIPRLSTLSLSHTHIR
ncbi:uncharacterized protein LOC143144396 [Ptiloglossa arizonensis]|uniref:uncharacterized protein LOC143144396 n=1 Tax=Ptiloglossa arizonensis TaxID=3350558 RepID=UPI003F9FB498